MLRFLLAATLLLTSGAVGFAQDMPLSQILIDGEGWKKVEKPGPKPKAADPFAVIGEVVWDGQSPNAAVRSPDGGTVFVGFEAGLAVWAYPAARDVNLNAGAPYCPLQVRRGKAGPAVTGLAVDRDGRVYAATEIGVQVFDPIGRLCGVLTPAAQGAPEHLAFEGDTLTLWTGDAKYARKLSAEGTK